MQLLLISLLCSFFLWQSSPARDFYTNHWAVRLSGSREEADEVAAKYGFNNLGQIGSLPDHYHFHHSKLLRRSAFPMRGNHTFISMDPKVNWVQQQVVRNRVKRTSWSGRDNTVTFNDPKWSSMWYINCEDRSLLCHSEMNIMAAWRRGYTGKNVVVTILDDGIEGSHPDLAQNFDPLASYDINGNDHDPTPRYDPSNENKHGTRCAGEVAAVGNNTHCSVGIAHHARIGGIRMLDGDVTDLVEAKALGVRPDYIHIYSASWGPDDDGKTVDGPGPLARRAFEMAVTKGRKGRGSIFVWASGNGGRQGDHCSCDGYTNSVYTISVGSTTESGTVPWYLEACASTLTSTYSSGESYHRKIVTPDIRQRCTDDHTGTSVSAPMVAGVIALTLEANPLLTWRDVQHLLVKTSRPSHLKAPDWKTNAAGLRVSHLYGYGLVDAEAMVLQAQTWRNVPNQHTCVQTSDRKARPIRGEQEVNVSVSTRGCAGQPDQHVVYLEHVVVRVLISHPRRGDLQISLVSPAGTRSQLLGRRQLDNSNEGFRNWEFMTVHCWGERAEGQWILEIRDAPSQLRHKDTQGKLKDWTLILHGTSEHPYHRTVPPETPVSDLEEEEEEYDGLCHLECSEQGCDSHTDEHCLNCVHFSLGSQRERRRCVSRCPLGYYGDARSRHCRRCGRGCETCHGGAPQQCRSCKRGLHLHPTHQTCVYSCPPGYYAEDVRRRCERCHPNCKKCLLDPDRCTACNEGYSLAGFGCVQLCPNRTFFDGESMKCTHCHHSCHTCTGARREECLRCADGFLQEELGCVRACSRGYYLALTAGPPATACHKCAEQCVSCHGPGLTCARCRSGYRLVGGACITNTTCSNADDVFCEMVRFNRLCDKKLFRQFCCRTCVLAG